MSVERYLEFSEMGSSVSMINQPYERYHAMRFILEIMIVSRILDFCG